ncbi:MAG: DNA-binding transcriptional regulator Fis [Pseudomonadota bacterium]
MVETRTGSGGSKATRRGAPARISASSRTRKSAKTSKTTARSASNKKAEKNKTEKKAAKVLRKGKKPLATMTQSALEDYFKKLNGTAPGDLYDLVLSEVERPLFRTVMAYTEGNQSRAAEILGINRGTLRKKLKAYAISVE